MERIQHVPLVKLILLFFALTSNSHGWSVLILSKANSSTSSLVPIFSLLLQDFSLPVPPISPLTASLPSTYKWTIKPAIKNKSSLDPRAPLATILILLEKNLFISILCFWLLAFHSSWTSSCQPPPPLLLKNCSYHGHQWLKVVKIKGICHSWSVLPS